MMTFQVEQWLDAKFEMMQLFSRHWEEVALNRDKIPLDPDYAEYGRYAATGILHIVTVRVDGILVGYHVSFVRPHLHYKNSLSAIVDIYYIAPEHRKGTTGVKLFKEAERFLKQRGVQKIFTGTKKHLDMGTIFKMLGYTEAETLYTKVIGD